MNDTLETPAKKPKLQGNSPEDEGEQNGSESSALKSKLFRISGIFLLFLYFHYSPFQKKTVFLMSRHVV